MVDSVSVHVLGAITRKASAILCQKSRVSGNCGGLNVGSRIKRTYVKNGEPQERKLLTLQPHRFAELGRQPYNISGYTNVRFVTPGPSDTVIRTILSYTSAYERFPPNTKGYLYFNRLKDVPPPFDCDIRFRVCDDHLTFNEGHDLQCQARNSVDPWSLSLHRVVVNAEKYGLLLGLRHMLLEEKLVDPDVVFDISRHPYFGQQGNVLHALDQPFVVDLSCAAPRLALMTRHIYAKFSFGHIFIENRRKGGEFKYPYTGAARVRLERSTLPEDATCPGYFLKFLEFLEPVKCVISDYDYHIQHPVVGGYLTKFVQGAGYTRWKFRPTESVLARELGEVMKSPLHSDYFKTPPSAS